MLESPAHRALSLSARKILDRLEIELYRHGGKPEENGCLPCTFNHFVEFGIERHAIGPAIRELVALGFVEITRKGCAGNAGYRQSTWYRLTYRHAGSDKRITDEWRRIETPEEAETSAKAARTAMPEQRPHSQPSAGNPHYLYISGGYAAADRWMQRTPHDGAADGPGMTPRPRRVGTKPICVAPTLPVEALQHNEALPSNAHHAGSAQRTVDACTSAVIH
jgi:hypothetical protein